MGAAVAALVLVALVPVWIGGNRGYGLGTTAAIAVILALGYQVTYGFSGQLSVAHAPLMGIGAYTVAQLTTAHGWSFWASLVPAALAAAAVGAVVGLPGLRVRGDVLALVTLGAGEILQSLFLNTTFFTAGSAGIAGVPLVSVFGTRLDSRGLYAVALALALLALVFVRRLRDSPLGRAWTALRDDEVAAAALGVRAGRLRVLAFAVGAALAGVAGALYAVQDGFVSSVSFGLAQSVTVILVVLVAGEGRLGRTVAAAVLVTALVDRLTGYGGLSEGVTGAFILLVVALRLGLFGGVAAAGRRLVPRLGLRLGLGR
ncbi:MAG: branched-chain amino acid transport system permease protein [Actinomycetota bacterium]|jgi:ABC-type branched-subunit amino acid transport system permease subunit|nr:branched-chain amino acid transport system permease protein [Actinomycetota bacterium]